MATAAASDEPYIDARPAQPTGQAAALALQPEAIFGEAEPASERASELASRPASEAALASEREPIAAEARGEAALAQLGEDLGELVAPPQRSDTPLDAVSERRPQQGEAPSQQPAAERATSAASLAASATSVAFVPTEHSQASEAPEDEPAGQHSAASAASAWRQPSERGKLPAYVQRAFRMKAYSLVFAQLSLAFAGAVVVDHLNEDRLIDQAMMSSSSFWVLCAISLACIVALYYHKEMYPLNYFLLAVTTVSITLTWSFGGNAGVLFKEETHLHLQVLAILVIAVFVTAVLGHFLSVSKVESELSVPFSFFIGWLVGSMANFFFLMATEDTFENTAFMAAGITFLLYGIVLIDIGGKLMDGNPDNFMRIVIGFNSTLLVLTSIPFLLLSFCLVRNFKHAEERAAREQQQSGGPPPARIPSRRTAPTRPPARAAASAAGRPARMRGP